MSGHRPIIHKYAPLTIMKYLSCTHQPLRNRACPCCIYRYEAPQSSRKTTVAQTVLDIHLHYLRAPQRAHIKTAAYPIVTSANQVTSSSTYLALPRRRQDQKTKRRSTSRLFCYLNDMRRRRLGVQSMQSTESLQMQIECRLRL